MRRTMSRTAPLVLGMEERPQEADGDGLDAFGDEAVDRGLRLVLVQRHDHGAEAIDPLRHALDEALGHDRLGLLAFGEMHDQAHVAALQPARAAHDVDDVVVALGGDEPDLCAALLHDRVGADGGAVRQERDLADRAHPVAMPMRRAAAAIASIMPRAKSSGVDGDFAVVTAPPSSITTQSVKVPPISTPTR